MGPSTKLTVEGGCDLVVNATVGISVFFNSTLKVCYVCFYILPVGVIHRLLEGYEIFSHHFSILFLCLVLFICLFL